MIAVYFPMAAGTCRIEPFQLAYRPIAAIP